MESGENPHRTYVRVRDGGVASLLSALVEGIEADVALDRMGPPLNAALRPLLRPGPFGDVVSGGAWRLSGVLANRCSHRGGPLAEGDLNAGCLRYPWHGSEFHLPLVKSDEGRQRGSSPSTRCAGQTAIRRSVETNHAPCDVNPVRP